jgi:hypothetical protein
LGACHQGCILAVGAKMLCLLILISKRICYGGVKMQCLLFLYREEVAVIVIIASSISLGVYPSKEQK